MSNEFGISDEDMKAIKKMHPDRDVEQDLRNASKYFTAFQNKCKNIGKLLYEFYQIEEERGEGCGNQMLQWSKDAFWTCLIKDHIPIFDETYKMLEEGKHYEDNQFVYGDADYYIHIEPTKKKSRKIIVGFCACACRDDSTHIFIKDEVADDWIKFRTVAVERTEVPSRFGNEWGDHRDIETPSLETFRNYNFDFGYGDFRDKCHVFKYDSLQDNADGAYATEDKIYWALWEMRLTLSNLKVNTVNA